MSERARKRVNWERPRSKVSPGPAASCGRPARHASAGARAWSSAPSSSPRCFSPAALPTASTSLPKLAMSAPASLRASPTHEADRQRGAGRVRPRRRNDRLPRWVRDGRPALGVTRGRSTWRGNDGARSYHVVNFGAFGLVAGKLSADGESSEWWGTREGLGRYHAVRGTDVPPMSGD